MSELRIHGVDFSLVWLVIWVQQNTKQTIKKTKAENLKNTKHRPKIEFDIIMFGVVTTKKNDP